MEASRTMLLELNGPLGAKDIDFASTARFVTMDEVTSRKSFLLMEEKANRLES